MDELMENDDNELEEELEVLKEIYISELDILRNSQNRVESVSLQVHPATGDREDQKWVCLTLELRPPLNYPEAPPEMRIRNPRGLAEQHTSTLLKELRDLAESRLGECMLFELIEYAKESITQGNKPHGECAICRDGFADDDLFTKTQCYHYFHSDCMLSYVEFSEKENEKDLKMQIEATPHIKAKLKPVVCPVCRDPVTYDLSALRSCPRNSDLSPSDIQLGPEIRQLQLKMSELFKVQQAKGGIIDLEEEKNKNLLSVMMSSASASNLVGAVQLNDADSLDPSAESQSSDGFTQKVGDDNASRTQQNEGARSTDSNRGAKHSTLKDETASFDKSSNSLTPTTQIKSVGSTSDKVRDVDQLPAKFKQSAKWDSDRRNKTNSYDDRSSDRRHGRYSNERGHNSSRDYYNRDQSRRSDGYHSRDGHRRPQSNRDFKVSRDSYRQNDLDGSTNTQQNLQPLTSRNSKKNSDSHRNERSDQNRNPNTSERHSHEKNQNERHHLPKDSVQDVDSARTPDQLQLDDKDSKSTIENQERLEHCVQAAERGKPKFSNRDQHRNRRGGYQRQEYSTRTERDRVRKNSHNERDANIDHDKLSEGSHGSRDGRHAERGTRPVYTRTFSRGGGRPKPSQHDENQSTLAADEHTTVDTGSAQNRGQSNHRSNQRRRPQNRPQEQERRNSKTEPEEVWVLDDDSTQSNKVDTKGDRGSTPIRGLRTNQRRPRQNHRQRQERRNSRTEPEENWVLDDDTSQSNKADPKGDRGSTPIRGHPNHRSNQRRPRQNYQHGGRERRNSRTEPEETWVLDDNPTQRNLDGESVCDRLPSSSNSRNRRRRKPRSGRGRTSSKPEAEEDWELDNVPQSVNGANS